MKNQFLHEALWPTITARVKAAKHNFAAVAYLGKGAKRLLPLHRNDVLVVDMSPGAVKSGQTNPAEIEKYLKAGVVVHSCQYLHAKVFVVDRTAVIGSGNASNRSKNILLEAALLTSDKLSVDAARAFVQSCMGELVTPSYVRKIKYLYHPPRIGRPAGRRKADHPRIWVQRLYPLLVEDEKRERADKSGRRMARKRMLHKRKYTIDTVGLPESSSISRFAELGDMIIIPWKDEDCLIRVYPPSRVLSVLPYTSSRGRKSKLVFVESPKEPKCIVWPVFKRKMKSFGWPHVGISIGREVIGREMKRKVLSLWPSWTK
jgi:hypothetical protein